MTALPIAYFECPETKSGLLDDLLLSIADELANADDRQVLEQLERDDDCAAILNTLSGQVSAFLCVRRVQSHPPLGD